LGGYTAGSRPEIFSKGCAPVQINYLGYPGTMASPAYDYIVADKFIIPENNRTSYTEKIIYLPSYQVNDSKKIIRNSPLTRASQGLNEDVFVFACFNNTYKINPTVSKCWINILSSVPNSVLWLAKSTESANLRLIKEFEKNNIEGDRIFFAERLLKLEDHLARLRLSDLFLDTFFYNAHTTASDALWAGLPVITLAGETFASRVAGSLLTALEVPELITFSQEEYERLAIDLASNSEKINNIRSKISTNKNQTQLFDTITYTRNFEKALISAHSNWAKGVLLKNIFIP
jgi:predicted O-linked N-acetylglucosamine transferase (SPINDLY family)